MSLPVTAPVMLGSQSWKFLYSQITSGEIGTQILFDSTILKATPTYGDGLFATGSGSEATDNFYTGLGVSIVNFSSITNESLVLANYYAQKQNSSYNLLGYMTNPVIPEGEFPNNPQFRIINFTDTTTMYHTLLFNSNMPNSNVTIELTYFTSGNVSLGTQLITTSNIGSNGYNYIFNMVRSPTVPWTRVGINVTQAANRATNIVGILKTPFLITPSNLVCFAKDSMVLTINGEVPIQDLKQGDQVYDEYLNINTVQFVAKRTVFPSDSINKYSMPVVIKKDSLDFNVPNRDTIASSAHLIKHNDQMVCASELGEELDVDTVITYYNVAIENYGTMIVNGMVTETLDAKNNSKMYEKKL